MTVVLATPFLPMMDQSAFNSAAGVAQRQRRPAQGNDSASIGHFIVLSAAMPLSSLTLLGARVCCHGIPLGQRVK